MDRKAKFLTFVEHLDEFRTRLIKSFAVFVLVCFFVYTKIPVILSFLIKPVGELVFVSPSEAFAGYLTLTMAGGIILSMPFWLFQIWQFIAVALTETEKRLASVFLPLMVIFFFLGVCFGIFAALPAALYFLLSFANEFIRPMITVREYFSFAGVLVLSFGFVFELPILIAFLTKIGLATPEFLAEKRKYAVVAIFIVSAVLTPPDCVSMILMALPLCGLYELSILLSRYIERSGAGLKTTQADF